MHCVFRHRNQSCIICPFNCFPRTGVYWACAAVCIKKQAANSCILDGCPAAVTAFDVPCLASCKNNGTAPVNQTSMVEATDDMCPGSSAWVHAKTTINTAFTNTCADVQAEVKARAEGSTSGKWTDPHNKGTYTIASASGSVWSLSRKTGNSEYTDKLQFTFTDSANGGCNLYACSESQVTSVLDFSTNYCNSHDLYCSDDGCHVLNTKLSYTESDISASSHQHSTSDCYKT